MVQLLWASFASLGAILSAVQIDKKDKLLYHNRKYGR